MSIILISNSIVFAAAIDIQQSPFMVTTAMLESIQNKNVGDVVKIGRRTGKILSKQLIEENYNSSFEVILVNLDSLNIINAESRAQTRECVAIGTHKYTTGTYYAYLYGSFYYSSNSVEVASKSYSFSREDLFEDASYDESENIFTHSRTLKLKYNNLSGLGWKSYTISLKCTTSGNVSANGF